MHLEFTYQDLQRLYYYFEQAEKENKLTDEDKKTFVKIHAMLIVAEDSERYHRERYSRTGRSGL